MGALTLACIFLSTGLVGLFAKRLGDWNGIEPFVLWQRVAAPRWFNDPLPASSFTSPLDPHSLPKQAISRSHRVPYMTKVIFSLALDTDALPYATRCVHCWFRLYVLKYKGNVLTYFTRY